MPLSKCGYGNSPAHSGRGPQPCRRVSALELIGTLDRERRDSTALEFTIVGAQAQILATSSDRPMDTLPVPATDEMMLQLRRGRPYVSLDTDSVGGYLIRAAAPLDANGSGSARVLSPCIRCRSS